VLSGDVADLLLGAGVERVRQHVDPQRRVPEVRRHGVRERFELLRYDGDRRLPPGRQLDCVADRPGGAGASIREAEDPDVDGVAELGELARCSLALFARPGLVGRPVPDL
jgi:hypothetical protein